MGAEVQIRIARDTYARLREGAEATGKSTEDYVEELLWARLDSWGDGVSDDRGDPVGSREVPDGSGRSGA